MQFHRILRRAGIQPWERLFHNLRASRETELAEDFPLHVVCEWIGNSAIIASKHYLQVTDAHFDKAATSQESEPHDSGAAGGHDPESGAECGANGPEKQEDCKVKKQPVNRRATEITENSKIKVSPCPL